MVRCMSAPLITPEIIATFRQGAGEAAEAWGRAFGVPAPFAFQDAVDVLAQVALDVWNNPGIAVVWAQATGAIVLLVADTASVFPAWVAEPDATAKSKLATLAQELGLIALPESMAPTGEQTLYLENMQEALLRCQPAGGQDALPLSIQVGDVALPAMLLGVENPAVLPAPAAEPEGAASPAEPATSPHISPVSGFGNVRSRAATYPRDFEDGIPSLPSYTRSLLKIKVPLVASLATTHLPVGRILEIGPGSIIQFDQSCEQPLSLAVGNHPFAVGEAVKVGEKFGLRITSMVMPEERFWAVRGRRQQAPPARRA